MISQFIGGSVDDNILTLPYTVFFAAWSILFLCTWRRRENEFKFLWGSEGYEGSERPLPGFKGKHVVNEETGQEDYVYTEKNKRVIRLIISWTISLICIGATIIGAIVATSIKTLGKDVPDDESLWAKNKWKVISAVSNLLIIVVFGNLYQTIAGAMARQCCICYSFLLLLLVWRQ